MGHWVRKTKEEYAKEVQRRRYSLKLPLLVSSLIFVLITLISKLGIGIILRTGEIGSPQSWAETFHQIPKFALASLGLGLISYILQIFITERSTYEGDEVICPKCETVKRNDNQYDCQCGGKFIGNQ